MTLSLRSPRPAIQRKIFSFCDAYISRFPRRTAWSTIRDSPVDPTRSFVISRQNGKAVTHPSFTSLKYENAWHADRRGTRSLRNSFYTYWNLAVYLGIHTFSTKALLYVAIKEALQLARQCRDCEAFMYSACSCVLYGTNSVVTLLNCPLGLWKLVTLIEVFGW